MAPEPSFIDPIDRLVAKLYRSAVVVQPTGFRSWALERIADVIPHDGALWGSGSWAERRFTSVTVAKLPADFPVALQKTANENPLIRHLLTIPPDSPTTMESVCPDEEFFESNLYRTAFEPVGITRILSTVHLDRRSGLYSLLSLYRKDKNADFSAEEAALQRKVTYHLFNAASHAFFIHLARTHRDRPQEAGSAVVDARGRFHEAQPRFLDMLDKNFPDRSGDLLPFALPAVGETKAINELSVRIEALSEMFVIHIWPSEPLDKLTQREREIVLAVAHGLSFKQAARKIGVAPSTVANHLYRIYRKLGVNSRTDLAKMIHGEEKKPAANKP